MSSLIVEVCQIDEVKPHPNADRLSIAIVKGWQCVVPKDTYKAGDPITYIPPDSVLPVELSDSIGVTKYLSKGRVRSTKLRGEPSFGVVCQPYGNVGEDVAAKLGIAKWIPPLKVTAGDAEAEHPMFSRYTDIENMRHFPMLLQDGEMVVATEKIHGTSSRIGMIREGGEWLKLAASKGAQRKFSEDGTYWLPWRMPNVAELMAKVAEGNPRANQIILFGEIYGKVQSLRYGLPQGLGYRAFDLMIDGRYMDRDPLDTTLEMYGVEQVPTIYEGPFSLDTIAALSKGKSMIPGADHIREGVVVTPMKERHDPETGRVILKYVSDDYLCGENDDAGE